MTLGKKMMKWALLLLIVFILFMPTASAVNYPQLKGFVTDSASIIDPVYEEKITQLAQKIEKETTVEIAVVTIESLEGESKEMYAVNLFKQAGIGKKDKDNGLLILVAKKEREYRFEVGYGLESTITDSMKVNIGDRIIVPNFRNGEYGKGIYESMVVIEGLVKGNEEIRSKYSMKQSGGGETYRFDITINDVPHTYYIDRNETKLVLFIILFNLILFGVFVKKYVKQSWVSLVGIDSILWIVTYFKSEGLFALTQFVSFLSLFLAVFIYSFRTGKSVGWSSRDRDGGFGGGFGRSSSDRSGSDRGDFGGGESGGGGFGGKW